MSTAPTVLVEPRSAFMGLPVFVSVVCLIAVASVLVRGIPADTSTRVAVGVFAAGAVACVFWVLRWRRLPPATLTIDHETIVLIPRGRPEPRTIARCASTKLRIKLASNNTDGPTAVTRYILFDETVGKPHIPIGNFGVDRVRAACRTHGWVLAAP